MSSKIPQKKVRKPKSKPEPVIVHEEPEIVVPEPVPEEEPEQVQETVESIPESETKEESKNQKKKLVYEELKSDIDDLLNKVLEDISEAKAAKNKGLISSLKYYEKVLKKVRSSIKKVEPKDKKTITRTQPSGFNKPLPITEEIANFAGWNVNDLKSRTDVTVSLCKYVKDNNLQKPDHRRTIIPDSKLAKILRYDSAKEPPLTYSTMQKYIGHLFNIEQQNQE